MRNFEGETGGEEVESDRGTFWRSRSTLVELAEDDENGAKVLDYLSRYWSKLRDPNWVQKRLSAKCGYDFDFFGNGFNMTNAWFFDIEACKRKNEPMFMMAYASLPKSGKEDLDLEVLFARDPSEEEPMIGYFLANFPEGGALVAYNSPYDLSRVSVRAEHNGLQLPESVNHRYHNIKGDLADRTVDLLPCARAAKDRLKLQDGKLQTFEKLMFKITRRGDISGQRIPQIWNDYVNGVGDRGKVEDRMVRSIKHNLLDVAILPAVMVRLCA